MKNKASLILSEVTVMLLVFALAAALCLRLFAWSQTESQKQLCKDRAYLQLQTAAEVLKHYRGNFEAAAEHSGGRWDGNRWSMALDADWKESEGTAVYQFFAVPDEMETNYLGGALLQISEANGEKIASLRICWQEVAP